MWLTKGDVGVLTLMSIVGSGLSWQVASSDEHAKSRAALWALLAVQMSAIGAAVLTRRRHGADALHSDSQNIDVSPAVLSPNGGDIGPVDGATRKQPEAEVQRHLHELAHMNMMSGMGEMAAAVVHELNQPLTAVLSNAQAARRMLAGDAPSLTDLREILDDIIEQDKRAGDVIQRIRRLLKKEQFDWAVLDFNALVRDVVRRSVSVFRKAISALSSDAVTRSARRGGVTADLLVARW